MCWTPTAEPSFLLWEAAPTGGGPGSFSDQSARRGWSRNLFCVITPSLSASTLPLTTENGGTSCWKNVLSAPTQAGLSTASRPGQVGDPQQLAGRPPPKGINDFRDKSRLQTWTWKISTGPWGSTVIFGSPRLFCCENKPSLIFGHVSRCQGFLTCWAPLADAQQCLAHSGLTSHEPCHVPLQAGSETASHNTHEAALERWHVRAKGTLKGHSLSRRITEVLWLVNYKQEFHFWGRKPKRSPLGCALSACHAIISPNAASQSGETNLGTPGRLGGAWSFPEHRILKMITLPPQFGFGLSASMASGLSFLHI